MEKQPFTFPDTDSNQSELNSWCDCQGIPDCDKCDGIEKEDEL